MTRSRCRNNAAIWLPAIAAGVSWLVTPASWAADAPAAHDHDHAISAPAAGAGKDAPAKPGNEATAPGMAQHMQAMQAMQAMHARMMAATPEERAKLMAEHRAMMQMMMDCMDMPAADAAKPAAPTK